MKIKFQYKGFLACYDGIGGSEITLLNDLPFQGRWRERELIFRASRPNLEYIREKFPDATWEGKAIECLDKLDKLDKDSQESVSDAKFIFKRLPREHQLKRLKESCNKENYALLMEQGTGKTKIILDNATYLYGQGKIDCLVIVAYPKGVHRNWIYELEKDVAIKYRSSFWADNHRTKKKKREIDSLALDKFDGLKIMTYNVEAMNSVTAQESLLRFLKNNKCMLVIDQSACIKNHMAGRTKFLIRKARHFAKYRRILDGDPASEGAHELYSQFFFLDPMIIGHETWTGFKAEFCIERNFGKFSKIVGYRNKERIFNLIKPHCCRDLSKDCQDLPDRIYKRWMFDLSKNEQRIYEDLRDEGEAFFQDDRLDMPDVVIKSLRLQQVSAGWFPYKRESMGEEVWDTKPIGSDTTLPSRMIALLELVKDIEGKAVIFSSFRRDAELISKHLKNSVTYVGSDDSEQREINKREFLTNPDVRFLIGNHKTASIGHTFVVAQNVIFYNNDYSLRMRTEAEKRAHREGQTKQVHVWDLCANMTQDTNILSILRKKRDVSSAILQDKDHFFMG